MADGSIIIDIELNVAEFQAGISKIQKIAGTGSSGMKKAFSAVADTMKAMVGHSLDVGQSFESQMSKVKAISGEISEEALPAIVRKAGEMGLAFKQGADATETAANIVASMAKKMGRETAWTATQAGEAFEYMAMAGWDTGAMLEGIAPIMNLATAAGEDLGRTSDIVTDAITAFGLKASDSSHFADVLAAASTNANTNVGMMGETFKYVGTICGAMGYSVDDAAAAIGVMANNNIKASQAGTYLRRIISNLAAPTDKMAAAMDEYGLALEREDGTTKSLSEVIGDLRGAFEGLSDTEKTALATTLAGRNAMTGMLALVNASDEDYKKLTDSIESCDGAAEQMAATMLDNLPGALTLMTSATDALGNAFYETFSDVGKDAVQEFTGYISRLAEAMDDGGIDGFLEELGSVAADGVARLVEVAPQALSAAAKVAESFIKGIGNAIQSGFASLAANVDLGALVGGIISGFISFAKDFNQAGTDIAVNLIDSLASGIAAGIPKLMEQAMPMLVGLSEQLRANAGRLVDAGINLLQNLAQGIANSLPILIQTVPTIVSNIAGIINDNAPKLLMAALGIISTLGQGLINAIPTLVENIPQIIMAIVDVMLAFNWIGVGQGIVNFLREGITAMATAIPETLSGIMDSVIDVISGIQWSSIGADIIAALQLGIETLAIAIPRLFTNIMNAAVAVIKSVDLRTIGKMLIEKLVSGITGLMGKVTSAFTAIVSTALSILAGLGKVALNAGASAVSGLMSFISQLPSKIAAVFTGLLAKVAAFGTSLKNSFVNIGKNAINGIISGIGSMVSTMYGAIKGALSGLVDKAKNALGIHSPSAVFRDAVGKWIPMGVAEGIEDNIGYAIKATSSLTSQVANSVKNANGELAGESYAKSIINGIKKQKKYAKKSAAAVGAAIVDAAEKKLKNYQTIHSTTAAYEVGFWKNIVNSCKKGTQAYYDAYSKYKSAIDNYNKGMEDAKNDLLSLEKNYASDVAKVEEQLVSDMNSLWDNYYNTVEKRSKELYSSLGGLFDSFSSKTSNTTTSMISNMKSQVDGLNEWKRNLSDLKKRGIDAGILDELEELGPKAAADVGVLASMTDTELESYVDLWRQKMSMCREQATAENSGLYEDTKKQVEKLKSDASAELKSMTSEFVSSVKELASKTEKELGALPKSFKSIGKDSINGITAAIKSNGSKLTDEVEALMTSAVKAAKNKLKIKSPSRVFRDEVGVQIPAGIAGGVERNGKAAVEAVADLSDDLVKSAGAREIPARVTLSVADSNAFADAMNATVKRSRSEYGRDAVSTAKQKKFIASGGGGGGEGADSKLAKLIQQGEEQIRQTKELIKESKAGHIITMNGKAVAKAVAKDVDTELGNRKLAAARGV